jgi:hypothetical protein
MTDSVLPIAVAGDTLQGADLQASIDDLLAMSADLGRRIADAPDVAAVQAIGRAQVDLRDQASALAAAQVRWLAGEARVSAGQIDAAAGYARGVVAEIADWKKAVTLAGQVVGFFSVVLTGDGAAIVQAAVALKGALDAA